MAQVASKVNGQLMRGIPPSIMCIQEIKIRSSDYVGFLVLSRIILFLFLKKKNFLVENFMQCDLIIFTPNFSISTVFTLTSLSIQL